MNPILALGLPAIVVATVLLLPSPGHATSMLPPPLRPTPPQRAVSPKIARQLANAYPEVAATLSIKWGRVFRVDKGWLRSQAYAESRNVPTAINWSTGALGILQIMPATANWLVASLRKSSFAKNPLVQNTLRSSWRGRASDLLDPDVNVMLAAYYMYLLKRKFGNRHDLVAAAYDAGPNKIAYYVDSGAPLPERSQLYIAMVADAKRRGFM